MFVLLAGCGGNNEDTTEESTSATEATAQGAQGAGGAESTAGIGQADTEEDTPFTLNTDQPVPRDFQRAYEQGDPITVLFYKQGQDQFYPQGLSVDDFVTGLFTDLRSEYPEVDFFAYEIGAPGTVAEPGATTGGGEPGGYGTLPAQLGVGYTPYMATLAPSSGGDYTITKVLRGYMTREVISQAIFDLTATDVQSKTSDVDLGLGEVQTTNDGGVRSFTVRNSSGEAVKLEGFSLRLVSPESGEATADSPGVTVSQALNARPGEETTVGRDDLQGGQRLNLSPGDQLALLDTDGAVVATTTV